MRPPGWACDLTILSTIRNLLRSRAAEPVAGAAFPALPPETAAVYAVGDVHGCLVELQAAEARIVADFAGSAVNPAGPPADPAVALPLQPAAPAAIVHLGDAVDRGPDSAGVIAHLLGPPPPGFTRHALLGNHEAAFLRFLDDPLVGMAWLEQGGRETLRSYGVAGLAGRGRVGDPRAVAREALASIPDEHLAFLRALPLGLTWRDCLFVHAGIRPGVPLAAQAVRDLLEIRKPFIDFAGELPLTVIHGHSPVKEPVRRGRRIAVDTGCYATGRLSAVRLDAAGSRFL